MAPQHIDKKNDHPYDTVKELGINESIPDRK